MRKRPKKRWGNSSLAINYRNWKCWYCGLPIKDGAQFMILKIDGNATPYDLCSQFCEKMSIIKVEAANYDKL